MPVPVRALRQLVNPARAGMIPLAEREAQAITSKPRASGDDPAVRAAMRELEA